MSTGNPLTIDGELQYMVQWFSEWSELQREDFLPVFVEFLSAASGSSAALNGITSHLSGATLADKPMSLFQCRIKLFREWSAKWPAEHRRKLQDKVQLIDSAYGDRVNNELFGDRTKMGSGVNGFGNLDGFPSSDTDTDHTENRAPPVLVLHQNEQVLA